MQQYLPIGPCRDGRDSLAARFGITRRERAWDLAQRLFRQGLVREIRIGGRVFVPAEDLDSLGDRVSERRDGGTR